MYLPNKWKVWPFDQRVHWPSQTQYAFYSDWWSLQPLVFLLHMIHLLPLLYAKRMNHLPLATLACFSKAHWKKQRLQAYLSLYWRIASKDLHSAMCLVLFDFLMAALFVLFWFSHNKTQPYSPNLDTPRFSSAVVTLQPNCEQCLPYQQLNETR